MHRAWKATPATDTAFYAFDRSKVVSLHPSIDAYWSGLEWRSATLH